MSVANKQDWVSPQSVHFIDWVNARFAAYKLSPPDESSEPCFDTNGKVKKRGAWDHGYAFSDETGKASGAAAFKLLGHQKIVRDFFSEESPYRGLLLFHGIGSGKTCSAIAVAEGMKQHRLIVLLSPASLRQNFMSELRDKCGAPEYAANPELIGKRYIFVSYDAPNMVEQIARIPDGLNNKLLVIDEAHNLISMIASNSTKGRFLYTTIMNTTNTRLLLLSGTPVINSPFEVAIAANLMAGFFNSKGERLERLGANIESKNKLSLFDDSNNFFHNFVSTDDKGGIHLKNKVTLMRRLFGLVSFYDGVQPRDKMMPGETRHIVRVRMSPHQFDLYERMRALERETEKRLNQRRPKSTSANTARPNLNLRALFTTSKTDVKMSNFRAFSRQLCNFGMPEGIPRVVPRVGDINAANFSVKEATKKSDAMQKTLAYDNGFNLPEDLADESAYTATEKNLIAQAHDTLWKNARVLLHDQLDQYSPKFRAMVDRIEASSGPAYVYSQFRKMEGLTIFSMTLYAHGYLEYVVEGNRYVKPKPVAWSRDAVTGKMWGDMTASERTAFRPLSYMLWPGAAHSKRREALLNTFNSEENKHGHVIKVFLTTRNGAEGLSLVNVRQAHIMEPYWGTKLIDQAIGRAARICSHATLPVKNRHVDVFQYISTVDGYETKDLDRVTKRPYSTDEFVDGVARRKKGITDEIEEVLRSIAFDCALNYAHNRIAYPKLQCFALPKNDKDELVGRKENENAYNLDVLKDKANDIDIRTVRKTVKKITFKGVTYSVLVEDFDRLKNRSPGKDLSVILYHDASNIPVATLVVHDDKISILPIAT